VAAVSLLAARAAFAPAHGLRAEYFASDRIDGTPALTGIDPSPSTAAIQHQWRASSPRVFAARWYGFLVIDRRDRYTFTLTSDDGAVLQVDGRTAVDNGGRHGLQTQAAALELDPGPHAIAVTFVQYGGTFALDLQLARGGEPAANVPPWRFTPEKTSPTTARAWRLVEVTAQWLLFVTMLLIPALAWTWRDRLIAHPHLSALALFAVLAVIHTWPLASDLAHLTRHDNRDSMLNEWIIGWVAHELPRNPLHLFDGNVFYPERHTLAYSEPMIVQAVMALPLLWAGLPLVATYNVLLIAGMALSGWTMAIVIRRWTGTWAAGLIAGSIYAFNAHTLSRIPHLQAQHVEFLPLALLAFDRLLEVPTARSAVRLAGWFILQGLTSVYLLVFSTFALAGAAVARVTALRRHPLFTLQALGIAAAVSVAALVPFLLPYGWVSRELHIVRSLGDAENFAASWPAYLTTPARIHASWSAQFADGNVLFPARRGRHGRRALVRVETPWVCDALLHPSAAAGHPCDRTLRMARKPVSRHAGGIWVRGSSRARAEAMAPGADRRHGRGGRAGVARSASRPRAIRRARADLRTRAAHPGHGRHRTAVPPATIGSVQRPLHAELDGQLAAAGEWLQRSSAAELLPQLRRPRALP